jgi:hypothetical protein
VMGEQHEHEQYVAGECRHGKEVHRDHRDHGRDVIREERPPGL